MYILCFTNMFYVTTDQSVLGPEKPNQLLLKHEKIKEDKLQSVQR